MAEKLDAIKFLTESRFLKTLGACQHKPNSSDNTASPSPLNAWPCCGRCPAGPTARPTPSPRTCAREIGAISRQAVYDALGVLAEKGIIRRIQPARSPALYEDRVGDNHHHLICRTCGKTVDVDCAVGHTPCLTAGSNAGFQIDEAEVVYWGTCPECLERNQPVIRNR